MKISVLTPAYNEEKYIAETIESILGQTFKDFEYIICDDCSTDKTWEIIQQYAAKDKRIIAIRNEKNLGYGGTYNTMIPLVRGEYVVCQSADDISLPHRIEHQLEFMEKNPEVGACGGYLLMFDGKHDIGLRKYPTDDASLRKVVFRYMPVSETAAMVRRGVYDRLGTYNENILACDLEMILRIGSKYKLANLPEILLKNRVHSNSVTSTRLKELELDTLEIRKRYMKNHGYTFTLFDRVYNFLQHISVSFSPPNFRIWLFMKMRDTRP